MALKFMQLHAARAAEVLNDEWFVLENPGPGDFVAQGCKVTVAKNDKARPSLVGALDPGFVLHPGERIRLVTGSPGKKAHGSPPDETDGCKNYHLFLGGPILASAGTVVRLVLNQVEMAKASFDPKSKHGVAAE
jgi:hypothetical protein